MPQPRVLVLRAPGTNCDVETAHAFELAGAVAERVHVGRLMENAALASRYQILCLPGGFSYGDDIAAGRILATRMRRHLGDLMHHFVDSGDNLVLGICNGMQVLMRLGVLTSGVGQLQTAGGPADSADDSVPPATLTWNNHGRFEDRWVNLAVDKTPCVFLRDIEQMYLPMAHAEGKFIARDAEVLEELRSAGRLALRYCEPSGEIQSETLPFPINPNGGDANVAGVCDASGRVFGLMPHPERHIDATQHPFWTRRKEQPEHGEGLQMFRNAVEWFA
ncbi:phosphoribosylformylglycinamidine synthase subunit PurQ [Rhodopirellula sp. P2]|uniref:phosphoribosylformylglycinamidine synthase subunit PurQ n=1 Tax=Rhodopirellula sp. P2 TaxID=2127060 RepID=UPI0023686B6C|nr:phosphoribosylformylglycinamidine synthase subunit PurQ [Rhodopirellula sp. P2]WDQ18193.1 phosphoribosylformylglycinamidine synthase subunit PurQ [Rhodopirellula sp. P2]